MEKDILNLGQKYIRLIGILCYNRWQGSYLRVLSPEDLGNNWKRFTDQRWDNLKINKDNNFSVLKHMKYVQIFEYIVKQKTRTNYPSLRLLENNLFRVNTEIKRKNQAFILPFLSELSYYITKRVNKKVLFTEVSHIIEKEL